MNLKIRRLLIVGLLILAVMIMSGCAKEETTTPTTPASPEETLETTVFPEATMSVIFVDPVVLMNDQVKVTVTNISDTGDSAGSGSSYGTYSISIKPEYRDTHYFLRLTLLVENLTDRDLAFGTGSMSMENEEGQSLEFAGGCDIDMHSCSSVHLLKLAAQDTGELHVVFTVPNELEQFTLYLLESQDW